MSGSGRRLRRWWGLLGLASYRTVGRTLYAGSRQLGLSIAGVALAVGLLLVVTGLAIGVATDTTVYGDDVDYWLVPEDGGASSALVATDGPTFGDVHDASRYLTDLEGVDHATPVLTEVRPVRTADGTTEWLLVVGVIASPDGETVAGVSTDGLTPHDPYYANGSYDGPRTGEAVMSSDAAALLGAGERDELFLDDGDDAEFTITAIDDGEGPTAPIVLVQLSELQHVVGADTDDRADQLLVVASDPAVESQLQEIYPGASVQTRADLTTGQAVEQELPLALIVTALLVSVVVGVLFTMTTMGLEVTGDANQLATLSAIGFSRRSVLGLVAGQTLILAGLGGLAGSGLAIVGTAAVNALTTHVIGIAPVAPFQPVMAGYGVGVGLLIGALTVPYLAVVLRAIGVSKGVEHQ